MNTDNKAAAAFRLSEQQTCWNTNALIVKVSLPASSITDQTQTDTKQGQVLPAVHAHNMSESAGAKQTFQQQLHVRLQKVTDSGEWINGDTVFTVYCV